MNRHFGRSCGKGHKKVSMYDKIFGEDINMNVINGKTAASLLKQATTKAG